MPKARAASKPSRAASACDCPDASGQPGSGGRRRAVAVDPAIKEANLKQLRRIEGQIRGIAVMIEQDRYCADIITQVSAARESLHAVARNLMRNHLTHCAAHAMRGRGPHRQAMVEELLDLVARIVR